MRFKGSKSWLIIEKEPCSFLMIVITLGKTHTMDFVITIHAHVPVTAVTPLYMIRCITGIASCQFL
jgi:hypothetical protein